MADTVDGGFWDFTANMSHGDLAYSNEALPVHTDTTYFTDPAGLQIFHLLSHPPPGTGGSSSLVDGFYTAALLRQSHQDSYDLLSRLGLPAHASGTKGSMLRPINRPTFTHDHNGELTVVRWNNEDRGVIGGELGWNPEDVRNWYTAARRYEALNKSVEAEYWNQMQPGTVVGESIPSMLKLTFSDRQLASDARTSRVHGLKEDVRCLYWSGRLEVQTTSFAA